MRRPKEKLIAGFDLHSNNVLCGLMDEKGRRLAHKKLPCDLAAILQLLKPYQKRIATMTGIVRRVGLVALWAITIMILLRELGVDIALATSMLFNASMANAYDVAIAVLGGAAVGALSAMLAGLTLALINLFSFGGAFAAMLVVFGLAMAAFVAYTHRANIERMRAGNENRARRLWLLRPR